MFAWVTGKLADGEQVITDPRRVTFHPFERPDFFVVETGETITTADVVTFGTDGKCYA